MSLKVEAVGEMTSLADRKRRAGQRLLLGFGGQAVDGDLRRLIAMVRPAGFVAFGRNLVEPAQVRDLTRELASLVDPHYPALLALDQEGGRVQAFKADATTWPPMRVVGRAIDERRDPGLAERVGRAIGTELRAVGFNLDLAPVADVDSNPANPVIGDRSFGSDPEAVAAAVGAFVRGLQSTGIMACAKHFPGHGDTATDSHRDLPIVERPDPELRRTELPPFRAAIGAGVATVMAAHVVYPEWDEDRPASLSSRVVPRILRRDLGFAGVVISDDLKMQAVTPRWSPIELVLGATAATVDLLLVGDVVPLQLAVFEELVHQQEEDSGFERSTITASDRVQALRERFLIEPGRTPALAEVGSMEHRMLAAEIEALGSMIAWLAALALGAEGPTCNLTQLPTPPSTLSVAWVSRLGDRAKNSEWLYVVATADLRAFLDGEGKGDQVRMLQWLGLRASERPPKRRYKVVIFDTTPGELCRPILSTEPALAGVAPCDDDHSGPHRAYSGCGYLTDLGTGRASSVVYRGQWQTLSADGFCVLPAQRFLAPDR